MYQYLNRVMWLVHIQKHIEELEKREKEGGSTVKCPHPEPRCPESFHSVLHLRFLLEDIHGIPMAKESMARELKAKKRSRGESEQVLPSEKRRKCKIEVSEPCSFINNTAATMRASSRRASKTSSGFSTPSYHSTGSTWSEGGYSGSNTPPSLVSSDTQVDLASDLDFAIIDEPDTGTQPSNNCQVPVVDLASEGEGLQEITQYATIKLEYESVNSSQNTSSRSTPSCSSNSTRIGLNTSIGYDTPSSSAFSEDLIGQAISPLNNPDLGAIEVVDLTGGEDIPQPSIYNAEASQSAY